MDRWGRDIKHYDKKTSAMTSALSGSFLPFSVIVFTNSGIMHELYVNPPFPVHHIPFANIICNDGRKRKASKDKTNKTSEEKKNEST
jgi:hypothetical protein